VPNIDRISLVCNDLNQYSIQPRYPEKLDVSEQDVAEALRQAKKVLEFINPLFTKKEKL
jgi:HEPN domain-containing protein